ncbi:MULTISPECIES: FAD-dependent oxidoreductase [Haloferacaceae]|uniref:FAD-dependent oxidoreductase n=1 Tax=Halorubrum glutamatedens TaxID=2707018 RepID=A0ABD5QNX2_9EURY|nr:FAD-dependent oxidoreductase [Halobellus captivus]
MYVVVGGGLAGLSAAARLREAGHEVRVFEASDAVGGRARTVDTAGDPLERFPHYVSPTADALPSLAADLGLGDRIARRRGRTARYRDGVVHRLDAPWERLAYPGTGVVDAVRFVRLTRAVRALDDASDDGSDGSVSRADLDATTAERFVVDRASRTTYEGYVEPDLRAAFGDRAGEVSAAWLAPWLRSWAARNRRGTAVDYVDGSTGRLVDAIIESIGEGAVRTGSRVIRVDPVGGRGGTDAAGGRVGSDAAVAVTVETPAGRRIVECAGVVVAGGPSTLRDVSGVDPGVEAVPGTCALVTTAEPIVDSWRMTVEPGALSGGGDAPFGTLLAHTDLVPPARYGGEHLTYLVGRGGGPADGDDGSVRDRWLSALEDLFPSFSREDVRSIHVARDPAAAVARSPGERVPVDLAAAGIPGVTYAGPGSHVDPFGGSPEARVAAGVAAAEALMDPGTPTEAGAVMDAETATNSGTTADHGTTVDPEPTADPASERDGSGFEWG